MAAPVVKGSGRCCGLRNTAGSHWHAVHDHHHARWHPQPRGALRDHGVAGSSSPGLRPTQMPTAKAPGPGGSAAVSTYGTRTCHKPYQGLGLELKSCRDMLTIDPYQAKTHYSLAGRGLSIADAVGTLADLVQDSSSQRPAWRAARRPEKASGTKRSTGGCCCAAHGQPSHPQVGEGSQSLSAARPDA